MTTVNTDTVQFILQNTLRGHSKSINLLAISPDQTRLISVGEFSSISSIPTRTLIDLLGDDSRVIIWSIASGEKLFVVERPFNGPATAAAWASHDNSRFVVGFASGDLHLFKSENKETVSLLCNP
jgi:WD40 repeat protein